MAIWGRLKLELDRASRAAQGAIDEGRVRLEIFRARQRADRAAQALGYALHRARKDAREIVTEELERLHSAIENAELEIARLESQLGDLRAQTPADSPPTATPPAMV
jgi:hypothetical protein